MNWMKPSSTLWICGGVADDSTPTPEENQYHDHPYPKDVESSIREAVQSGQFASIDEAMTEAARLLLRRAKRAKPAGHRRKMRCSGRCSPMV